jgi:CheY-like chemotaxis protein
MENRAMKILAVDDDPVVLDLLSLLFKHGGFSDVNLVSSGPEALGRLAAEPTPFDCLIVDLCMPDMDGTVLCERIRTLPAYRTTPIIMLTARHDHPSIEAAFAAGATDYITKPFEVNDILTRVQIAIRMIESEETLYLVDPTEKVPNAQPGAHQFDVSDPLHLLHVDQHTRQFSLGNYLSQLSRKRIDDCLVFAVSVDSIHALYETCTTQEFAIALSEVNEAINGTLKPAQLLTAYFGLGIFVCVSTDDIPQPWAEIQPRLQDDLDSSGAIYDTGQPMGITVAVGCPVRPNASKTQRVRRTFDRATQKLRRRAESSGNLAGIIDAGS